MQAKIVCLTVSLLRTFKLLFMKIALENSKDFLKRHIGFVFQIIPPVDLTVRH